MAERKERIPTENLTIEGVPKPLLTFIQKYIELVGIDPQEFWRRSQGSGEKATRHNRRAVVGRRRIGESPRIEGNSELQLSGTPSKTRVLVLGLKQVKRPLMMAGENPAKFRLCLGSGRKGQQEKEEK